MCAVCGKVGELRKKWCDGRRARDDVWDMKKSSGSRRCRSTSCMVGKLSVACSFKPHVHARLLLGATHAARPGPPTGFLVAVVGVLGQPLTRLAGLQSTEGRRDGREVE